MTRTYAKNGTTTAAEPLPFPSRERLPRRSEAQAGEGAGPLPCLECGDTAPLCRTIGAGWWYGLEEK